MKFFKVLFTSLTALLFTACTSGNPKASKAEPASQERSSSSDVAVDRELRTKLQIVVKPAALAPAGQAIIATGQLQVNEDAAWHVGAITDGKIIGVPVAIGDSIRRGQVLARLHSHDVHDARASYRQALAELQRQKTLATQALTVRDRTKRLFDLRAASREQLEAAETTYQSINASVSNAEAEVEKAKFHLTDFLEVSVEGPGPDNHDSDKDSLTIKSPESGTLMERKVTAGSVVSAGDPVFTIANLTQLWMIAAVNEADMAQVYPGQHVLLTVRAFPDRKFEGRVSRLGERLDPQTRTLQVRVLVPNGQGLLKPDMFATAEFQLRDARQTIQLPEAAIQELEGKTVVFVQGADGNYAVRQVTLGERGEGTIEVESGVKEGEPVVVRGGFLLKSQLLKGSGG